MESTTPTNLPQNKALISQKHSENILLMLFLHVCVQNRFLLTNLSASNTSLLGAKPLTRGELMLGNTVQTLHVTIVGASLDSHGLSIVYHIYSIQNFQIKIRSFLHYLFSNFEYYMGNCVHCFMVLSLIHI